MSLWRDQHDRNKNRYDTTVLDARALADALEAEEKAGWEVAEAAYDGTDFVVTFEREGAL